MKNIVILGSTGTIGLNTLEVIRNNKKSFNIIGLACKKNKKLLSSQIKEFKPKYIYLEEKDPDFYKNFPGIKFLYGEEGLIELTTLKEADIIVGAIPGIKTLVPILESLKKGKTIGLATKEILVVAGQLIMNTTKKYRAQLLPIDSEHNAIFQILEKEKRKDIEKIYLTASGGPFLKKKNLKNIKIKQALSHPIWKMGGKITIDSATLMNKAFEIIEAHYLFSLPEEKIGVLIHPEAIVHGIVELKDGILKGVLSPPDMKFAINFVLNYPNRKENFFCKLDLSKIGKLSFEKVRENEKWLFFAKESIKQKGSFPVVLNGANEEAVNLFFKGKIKFHHIFEIIEKVIYSHKVIKNCSIKDIFEIDKWAHNKVREITERIK